MKFIMVDIKHAAPNSCYAVIQAEHIMAMTPAIGSGTDIQFVDGSVMTVVETANEILSDIDVAKER